MTVETKMDFGCETRLEDDQSAAGWADFDRKAAERALANERDRTHQERAGRYIAEAERDAERNRRQAIEIELREIETQRSDERRRAERERNQLATKLAEMRDYSQTLEKLYSDVLQSETWRAMEPARRVIRLFRGRRAPQPFVPRLTGSGKKKVSRTGAGAGRLRRYRSDERDGKAEVARYVHHLWGGLSQPAVRELTRVLEDAEYDPESRFKAAHKLATWHASDGDLEAALAAIRAIDRVAPSWRDAKERWVKEGFIQYARGDRESGRAAFAHFLAGRPEDPDARLALSNALENDALRLAAINGVFERAGFARLERIDASRPLALDNIRGRGVVQHPGGLGRVSVLVPAYNAEGSIGTALASLRAQSYADLEIIVVDDASTDGTADVVAEMAREDSRIRLIRQERNAGAYAARNRGLAEATGAFITTHDADDWSHPQKIETQLTHLVTHQQLMGVCSHWARVRRSLEVTPHAWIGSGVIHWNHSSFLFRREILDALGPWDPIRVGADTELIWRVEAANGKGAVKNIAKKVPLAFALTDDASLTRVQETHVRSIYFGLRQIYRATAQYSHADVPDPEQATQLRLRASPAALFRKNPPIVLDFLLLGDCTDPAIIEEMLGFIDGPEGRGQRVGIFHWPDFDAPPSDLCPSYCALISRDNVEPIPPSGRIQMARRHGIFFGHGHTEVDQFPVIDPALGANHSDSMSNSVR